jgi:hypothetical protein
METAMRNTENIADVRLLTNAETENVTGGALALALIPAAAIFCLQFGIGYGDLPLGTTTEDAAAALGVSYLL